MYRFWITLKLVIEQAVFTHRKCLQTESGRAVYSLKIGWRPFKIPLLFSLRKSWQAAEGTLLLGIATRGPERGYAMSRADWLLGRSLSSVAGRVVWGFTELVTLQL